MRRFKGFFALSPEGKSAESGRRCGDDPAGGVSTVGSHQMAHARVVAHPSSWTPAACELEESSSSKEQQGHEMMFQNFLMGEGSKETQ